jgi:hypothetical protein
MCLLRPYLLAASLAWLTACGGSTTSADLGTRDPDGSVADADHPIETGGSDNGMLSCAERTGAASALVKAAARAAEEDLSCQTDEDCLVVWATTECSDTCSELVSRSGAEKIRAAIEEANRTACRGFDEAGCMIVHPPCVAPPQRWICVSAMCVIVLA